MTDKQRKAADEGYQRLVKELNLTDDGGDRIKLIYSKAFVDGHRCAEEEVKEILKSILH